MTKKKKSKDEDKAYKLTPKGFLVTSLGKLDISMEEADEVWHQFEAFCIKNNPSEEAAFTALVFDGAGGDLVGVNLVKGEE